MSTNKYFTQGHSGEQSLYESLIIESIKIYGQDLYYIPRTVVSTKNILNEPSQSKFESYYEIEMYLESFDGFGGEGNLFQKFGIEIRDQINLVISRRRFDTEIGWEINRSRPYEGDLIYIPVSKSLFEIKFVESELPFYILNTIPSYKLQCELFEYSGEDFSTGLYEIDNIEYTYGSGGIKIQVEFVDSPIPNLNTITLGERYTQGDVTGKLYSIEEAGSPSLYEISLGQITGNFSISDSVYLIGNDSSLRFEIKDIYGVDDALENEDVFPGDKQADNVGIEKEADDIIDFSENNPFGNF
jgi:hypothetical protein